MSYELILAAFPGDMEKAGEQLSRYESSQDELGISEAVAVVKTEEGEDQVKLMGDPKKLARRIGAVGGAMLGILGGPPAWPCWDRGDHFRFTMTRGAVFAGG